MTTLDFITAHFEPDAPVELNDTLADLGADLLDLIHFAIAIDDQLGVYIHEDRISLDTTVSEIVEMVEQARKEAA